MDYLVDCPCGHALGRHDVSGCAGPGCTCERARWEALDAAIDTVAQRAWNDASDAPLRDVLRAPAAPRSNRMSRIATMDEIVGAVGADGQERDRAADAKGPPPGIFWGCGCVASRAPQAGAFVWLRCDLHRQAAGA